MPPPFRFPFRYGSIPAPVVVPTSTPPLWGNVTSASAQNWIGKGSPSQVPRMERVYDQVPEFNTELVEYAHRIKSQFPWIIGNSNQIYLRSVITTP